MEHENRKRSSKIRLLSIIWILGKDYTSNDLLGKLLFSLWESISEGDEDVFFFWKVGRLFVETKQGIIDALQVKKDYRKIGFLSEIEICFEIREKTDPRDK